jgi:hypothetical protein
LRLLLGLWLGLAVAILLVHVLRAGTAIVRTTVVRTSSAAATSAAAAIVVLARTATTTATTALLKSAVVATLLQAAHVLDEVGAVVEDLR